MMGLKKRNKPKESTDVLIKLKISVPDVNNCNSCHIVDSLLNEIWNIALSKEGVEVEDLKATYVKEKTTK
ncbi:hypothetical protein [uncultured Holdemanella sp.]|uniref:hypothetical protein n=1 Tax=uncultured Holdemanella sp. TaxID=1763549 RepID=UPI0025F619EE|nr:hypothetical protein [uncultured Holdemanella sp.]